MTRYDGTGRKSVHTLPGDRSYDGVAWSPDGSKLAFSTGGHLYVVGDDGHGLERLL